MIGTTAGAADPRPPRSLSARSRDSSARRQGGRRQRQHGQPRLRRRRAEGALGSTLAVPALPQVGVRLRPGRPSRATELVDADPVADPVKPLAGKVAVITGASRGIGEAMARTLHRDGATIVGSTCRSRRRAGGLMAELGGTRRRGHHLARRAQASPRTSRRNTTASTSSCTTPASPATRGSRTWSREPWDP